MLSLFHSRLPLQAALLAFGVALLVGACGDDIKGAQDIQIQVEPTTVSFSAIPVGTTADQIVTVKHTGTEGTLRLLSLELKSGSSADFAFTQPEKTELAVGEETSFLVTFAPSDAAADNGTLILRHNVPGQDDIEIRLQALGALATLYFQPDPIEFGEIEYSQVVDKTIRLSNGGADRADIQAIVFSEGTSDDFELLDEPTYPAPLEPGQELTFTLRYTPAGGNIDSGQVIAEYTNEEGDLDSENVYISGTEIVPDILVSPGALDFGWMAVNTPATRPVTIVNEGTDTLIVDSIEWDAPHDALTMTGADSAVTNLEPGESAGFMVEFNAAEAFPLTTDPIAHIVITSNDPEPEDENPLMVPIYARIEAPVLRVSPEPPIDFAIVAQNLTVRRQATLFNAGHADLVVTGISVNQGQGVAAGEVEFDVLEDAAIPPTTGSGQVVIPANTGRAITLTFTNLGGDQGEAWGELVIESNDSIQGVTTVNLHAQRGGAPYCDIVFQPGTLDYGIVAHGNNKKMTMKIENRGTGNCSFLRAEVSGCSGSMFPGFPASCSPGASSDDFKIVRAPVPVAEGIQPGDTADIEILFEPPEDTPLLFEFDEYYGLLQVTMNNPYGPPGQDNTFKVPDDGGGGISTDLAPNLHGKSGISRISVLPDHIDFGLVTLGCYSMTHRICVYNSGQVPLTVNNIEMPGCSSEFNLKNLPAIPADVTTAQPWCFEVVYLAQNLGEQSCNLVIDSSDGVISVPLTGEGTLESSQCDHYVQVAGQEVDILFVVDDSGSMCEEQDRLARNLEAFINHAQTWNNSYQIGVVSTCVQEDDVCEGAGQLKSEYYPPERWVTNTTWPHFAQNVDLGCDGGSDSQEAALEAAHLALSLPHSYLSDIACGSNADCQAPAVCLPDLAVCGGFNGGFLRDDAALEIVILSDEEDQSPAPPDFYVDFFKSIKGFANESFLHVHSIVGDEGSGCGDSQGTGTSAAAGDRYIYVSEETGGRVESICNDSFAEALSDIGIIAFDLKVQFFLSRAPEPSTIAVTVNGDNCATGWVYDPPSNSIIFDREGNCMPEEGDEIDICYEAICFTS